MKKVVGNTVTIVVAFFLLIQGGVLKARRLAKRHPERKVLFVGCADGRIDEADRFRDSEGLGKGECFMIIQAGGPISLIYPKLMPKSHASLVEQVLFAIEHKKADEAVFADHEDCGFAKAHGLTNPHRGRQDLVKIGQAFKQIAPGFPFRLFYYTLNGKQEEIFMPTEENSKPVLTLTN
jgi:carbonic anhydrase